MTTQIHRLPSVRARSGLSTSSIYRRIKDGTFPAPVKLGPRASGWREEDLERWAQSLTVRGVTSAVPLQPCEINPLIAPSGDAAATRLNALRAIAALAGLISRETEDLSLSAQQCAGLNRLLGCIEAGLTQAGWGA